MDRRVVVGVIVTLVGPALGCSGSGSARPDADEPSESTAFQRLAASYQELGRVTEQPIEFRDYGLCRIPIRGLDTPFHTAYGQIHVYAGESARPSLAERGTRSFPDGSVIVKEKLDRTGSAAGTTTTVAGVGMMIKRDGEWTYAYAEQGQLFEGVPELEYCRQCHLTGEVPADLVEIFGLGSKPGEEIEIRAPRDSVFLTLPLAATAD